MKHVLKTLLIMGVMACSRLWATQVVTPVFTPAGGTYATPQPLSPANIVISVAAPNTAATIHACYTAASTPCVPGSTGSLITCPSSGNCSVWVAPAYPAKDQISAFATQSGYTQSNTTAETYEAPAPNTIATGDSIARTEPVFPASSGCTKYRATAYQVATTTVNLDPWNPTASPGGTITSTGGTSFEPSSSSSSYVAAETDDAGLQTAISSTAAGGCVEVTLGSSGQDALVENLSFQPQNGSNQGITLVIDGGVRIYRTRNISDYNSGCGTVSTSATTSCNKWITPTAANNANIYGYGILDGRGWSRFTTTTPCASGYSPCSFETQRLLTLCTTHSDAWPLSPGPTMHCTGAPAYQLSYGPDLLYYSGSSTTRLYKITLLNGSTFGIYWGNTANDFLGWGIKDLDSGDISNTDNIDPTAGATNFSCYYCVVSGGDNCVAIKTSSGSGSGTESDNITFAYFQTGACIGITIGYNTQVSGSGPGVNNVLVTDFVQNSAAGQTVNPAQQVGHGINLGSSQGGPVNLVTYQHGCVSNETESTLYTGGPGQMTNVTEFDNHYLNGSVSGNSGEFVIKGESGNDLGITLNSIIVDGSLTTNNQYATMTVGAFGISSNLYSSLSTLGTGSTLSPNSVPAPTTTNVPCTSTTWKPLIGEMWLATGSADNLQNLTTAAPATYTLKATVIPATAFPRTKESYFLNETGTQGNPVATVEFLDNGSPVSGCTAVTLIHGDEFASCALSGIGSGTHNYTVEYNPSGVDTHYPTAFTWGNPGTGNQLTVTVTGVASPGNFTASPIIP